MGMRDGEGKKRSDGCLSLESEIDSHGEAVEFRATLGREHVARVVFDVEAYVVVRNHAHDVDRECIMGYIFRSLFDLLHLPVFVGCFVAGKDGTVCPPVDFGTEAETPFCSV